jgi:Cd2+/Zn2+-exporting ATPase
MSPGLIRPAMLARGEPARRELRVSGMDCASCAAAVRGSLTKLEGVSDVEVDVVNGRVRVEFANERLADRDFTTAIERAGYRVTDGTQAGAVIGSWTKHGRLVMAAIAGAAFLLGLVVSSSGDLPLVVTGLFAVSTLSAAWYVVPRGLRALRSGALDMNFLMSIAAVGAWAIGEPTEAAATLFLFSVAELLEAYSMDRARNAIKGLMDLSPTEALLLQDGKEVTVPAADVSVGDTIVIRPGAKIPLDGEVISGDSSVNQAPITGESLPVDKATGDTVFAGTLNTEGALRVRVTRPANDTTLARIIHAVEDAQGSRAPSQRFVEKFARIYTPAVVALAVAMALFPPLVGFGDFSTWLYRALTMLVVACPCALVISTPITIVSALTAAARSGILIKGGAYLESLGAVRHIAFDKTGTLTQGTPSVVSVVGVDGNSEADVLKLASAVEQHSEHPLARAIMEHDGTGVTLEPSADFRALVGRGARALVGGNEIYVANERLMQELGTETSEMRDLRSLAEKAGQTTVSVSTAEAPIGLIALADMVRPQAAGVLARLKRLGFSNPVMMTGDSAATASAVARQIGINDVRAGLLPDDKLIVAKELSDNGGLVFVGDGVNDAPALAASTVGVAMGVAGSDVALEAADIALMGDDLGKLADGIELSRRALSIVKQNIAFSIATKAIFVILAVAGQATLWMAIAADMGASLLVVANGLRMLRFRPTDGRT